MVRAKLLLLIGISAIALSCPEIAWVQQLANVAAVVEIVQNVAAVISEKYRR